MARDLELSRNTVTAALDELIAEGWAEARRGSGVYVLQDKRERKRETADEPADGPMTLPFDVGPPGLDMFPIDAWRRIQARRWAAMPPADLREGASAGFSDLRTTIANHAWVAHGVPCTPDQVIVTQGVRSGLDLVLRCLTRAGDQVWLETPGYFGFRALVEGAGRRAVDVPVDSRGLDVGAGRVMAPNAPLAVVTPQVQMPTCIRLDDDRRQELLTWASENGSWIFEDDYDAEFRFDEDPRPPLAAYPGAERVIYAHSFNKTLFPALRIGFLILPPGLTALFIAKRKHADGYPSVPDQMVLRDFMEAGQLDSHVRACRVAYEERKAVMYEWVEGLLAPWMRFERHPSGLQIVAWLRGDLDPHDLKARAAAEDIELTTVDRYFPSAVGDRRLLFGFAGYPPRQLIKSARALVAILKKAG
jgi:GntR family transcriptional regulator/MocR family aminotransferase